MPSRPFKPYMGKNTFGTLKESQDAGQYILNKKASVSFCGKNICRTLATQSNRLLLRNAKMACQDPYNTANLNINLVTVLDLSGVPVIQQNDPYAVPANLDITSIPYLDYTIDPSGNLFGNTICGTNNYQNYLRPNLQLSFFIINGNYEITSNDTYNTIITFYSDNSIRFLKSISVIYIVVGGGGGGGGGNEGGSSGGGGGGGGGVSTNSFITGLNIYNIIVGNGGSGGASGLPAIDGISGQNSEITGVITVLGGSYGKSSSDSSNGGNSGNGGAGGAGDIDPGGNGTNGGGGGGGAYSGSGDGGNGAVSLTSVNTYGTSFGAGGGGGDGDGGVGGTAGNIYAGAGGDGGSVNGGNGTANYGGGGGGGATGNGSPGSYGNGGNGGSGVVILLFNV
jgi:hypothetical protein